MFINLAIQEKVLKSISLLLKCHPALSYKNLVHSVLLKVKGNDPDSIKPSVEHIVNLLSIASCFQVNIKQ